MHTHSKPFIDWFQVFIEPVVHSRTADQKLQTEYRQQHCVAFCQHFFPEQDKMRFVDPFIKGLSAYVNPFGIVLTFSGEYFTTTEARFDLPEVIDKLQSIMDYSKLGLTMKKPSLSRIDISVNTDVPVPEITYKVQRQCAVEKFFLLNELTGIRCGKGTKDAVQLRIYAKASDPNRAHAFIRFGSIDHTRIEYQVGHKILKDWECNDPFKLNPITVWRRAFQRKPFFFEANAEMPKQTKHPIRKPLQRWQYALETVQSIFDTHLEARDQHALLEWISSQKGALGFDFDIILGPKPLPLAVPISGDEPQGTPEPSKVAQE